MRTLVFSAINRDDLFWRRAHARTSTLETLYGGQFTLLTHLTIPNYPAILSHRRSTTVSLETYPFNSLQVIDKFGRQRSGSLICCSRVWLRLIDRDHQFWRKVVETSVSTTNNSLSSDHLHLKEQIQDPRIDTSKKIEFYYPSIKRIQIYNGNLLLFPWHNLSSSITCNLWSSQSALINILLARIRGLEAGARCASSYGVAVCNLRSLVGRGIPLSAFALSILILSSKAERIVFPFILLNWIQTFNLTFPVKKF